MSRLLPVSQQSWIDVASDDACVNARELMQWLSIKSRRGLLSLMGSDSTFPQPRFGKFGGEGKGGAPARWRVGDVRAWLRGTKPTTFQLSDNPGRTQAERRKLTAARGDVEFVRKH